MQGDFSGLAVATGRPVMEAGIGRTAAGQVAGHRDRAMNLAGDAGILLRREIGDLGDRERRRV
jgi:hypothetical protein